MAETESLVLSDKKGVHALVMAAHHYGVEHVVICPGSRNAPFTISFSRSGLFQCHSIVDERVAAFYALGMALATGKPVVVVCTSGSAGINLGPAIAEAFYLKAPLIAITADRPVAWVDQGNGQTIRQEGLFAKHVCGSYTLLEDPHTEDELWMNRREISKLFNRTLQGAGPVHFNAPLGEPLYRTATYPCSLMPRFYERVRLSAKLPEAKAAALQAHFAEAPRVMLLLGQLPHIAGMAALVEQMAGLPQVVVLSETTSNVHAAGVISTIDRLIMSVHDEESLRGLMPDVLITMGGMVVSKKIKALLRTYTPSAHWHVNPSDEGLDTYRAVTEEIALEPAEFLSLLLSAARPSGTSRYAELWRELDGLGREAHAAYLPEMPWCDFKAFELLMQGMGSDLCLHMANSSPVRYVQLFGSAADVRYHANRGTSGIDGSTSTAMGWAMANPDEQVLLVTGDTAFMYDSNALWNRALPANCKIVVINNSGGGIFRIIDGPGSTEELEPFFEAHHPVNLERIASAFDMPHYCAGDVDALRAVLPKFLEYKGSAMLEIRTPAGENAPVLKGYFRHIAAHIDRAQKSAVST